MRMPACVVCAAGALVVVSAGGLCGCGGLRWRSDEHYRRVADDSFVAAQLALDQDDDVAALEALNRALEADPRLSTAHAAVGDIHWRRQDMEMAVTAYERAVAANAWNFRNHYNCAFLHQSLADRPLSPREITAHLERSVELYARAAELYPSDYDARLNLGVCLLLLERHEDAEDALRAAIALDPDMPEAYADLGLLYDRLETRPFDAMEMYNRSLELKADQPQVLMNLARIQASRQRLETALANYERAFAMDPTSAAAVERIGYCQFQLGQVERAQASYARALELDAGLALAHRGMGVVLMSRYLKAEGADPALRAGALDHWRTSLELDGRQEDLEHLLRKYAPAE